MDAVIARRWDELEPLLDALLELAVHAGVDLDSAIKDLGESLKDRIERDGEHDTPGQDRHKRTDQDEGPEDQDREQSEPDHKLDNLFSGEELAECSHGPGVARMGRR